MVAVRIGGLQSCLWFRLVDYRNEVMFSPYDIDECVKAINCISSSDVLVMRYKAIGLFRFLAMKLYYKV